MDAGVTRLRSLSSVSVRPPSGRLSEHVERGVAQVSRTAAAFPEILVSETVLPSDAQLRALSAVVSTSRSARSSAPCPPRSSAATCVTTDSSPCGTATTRPRPIRVRRRSSCPPTETPAPSRRSSRSGSGTGAAAQTTAGSTASRTPPPRAQRGSLFNRRRRVSLHPAPTLHRRHTPKHTPPLARRVSTS